MRRLVTALTAVALLAGPVSAAGADPIDDQLQRCIASGKALLRTTLAGDPEVSNCLKGGVAQPSAVAAGTGS